VPDADEAYLQIGEVAERTGVTQRTLHIRRLQDLLGVALAEIKDMVDAEETLRELRAQYRPDADVAEKRRQLQRAIEVVQAQYAIVKQKTGQMSEMKAHLEERLKTFDRWAKELDEIEKKEAVVQT